MCNIYSYVDILHGLSLSTTRVIHNRKIASTLDVVFRNGTIARSNRFISSYTHFLRLNLGFLASTF